MKFIDEIEIIIESGKGGNGCVSFRREKFVPKGGANGGDGGNGGDIVIRSSHNLSTLADIRHRKKYKAGRGGHGRGSNKKGKRGNLIVINVPEGTIVTDLKKNRLLSDLSSHGQEIVAVRGGRGGRGNARFTSSTIQTPDFAEEGENGKILSLKLELKLLADVGVVGFPNSGKSTFLSRTTSAKPKIAGYPFTTLIPNLGIVKYNRYKSFVIADIPGIIEGAHTGKGLGDKFLKHIERTCILLFLIPSDSNDIELEYKKLLKEIGLFNESLLEKPRIVTVSKADLINKDKKSMIPEKISGREIYSFSSVSGEGLDNVLKALISTLQKTGIENG